MTLADITDELSAPPIYVPEDTPEDAVLWVQDVDKSFTLHMQNSLVLPVVENVTFDVPRGQCVILGGPSGTGKSTIIKMIYGSYRVDRGQVLLVEDTENDRRLDLAAAQPREILAARRSSMGYVSQFLSAIPRVAALDIVAEPMIEHGYSWDEARQRAGQLLDRLSIPKRMWDLPPATFSGGEQQRINIARGFAVARPLMLLDEPTASLDARNRGVVVEMIRELLAAGVGILAICHDAAVREAVADHIIDVSAFTPHREESA